MPSRAVHEEVEGTEFNSKAYTTSVPTSTLYYNRHQSHQGRRLDLVPVDNLGLQFFFWLCDPFRIDLTIGSMLSNHELTSLVDPVCLFPMDTIFLSHAHDWLIVMWVLDSDATRSNAPISYRS
ncbi:hypothetical protein EDB87DRAFT_1582105 [Lactarius vividus]|nr:hypothetical protein EDB87DRAFT_1582105 [Lactarius vividus]